MLILQLIFYQALDKWNYNPDIKFKQFLPENIIELYKSKTDTTLLDEMKKYLILSMVTHYFVLMYQVLEGNFNEGLEKTKNDFIKMKFKIDENGSLKTINAKQLFDIIRQAFAHNDDDMLIPNWNIDNKNNIIIHNKYKKNDIEIKINIVELMDLLNMYLVNSNDNSKVAITMYENRLSDAIGKNKVNQSNIHKYVGAYDLENKIDIPLDKWQKKALYNFFIVANKDIDPKLASIGIHPYSTSLLSSKFPLKHNALNILKDYRASLYLLSILSKSSLTKNEFIVKIYDYLEKNNQALNLIELNDYLKSGNRFEFSIASSILFSIFSNIEPNKIKTFLNRDIDFKRIRNSLMHGRFYYNYENGFNFYDGIVDKKDKNKSINEMEKNINYIDTLTLEEIYQLTLNLVYDYRLTNKNKR